MMNMQSKDWLIFRILLNRFHPKSNELFLKNMPQDEARFVLNQKFSSTDVSLLLTQPESLIEKIHYSWLLDTFNKIPKSLHASILASMPDVQYKALSQALNIPEKKLNLSPIAKRFLINMLYAQFEKKEILPLEFLPENPLLFLCSLKKQQLVTLIDYLGIYDLAEEIRHIVEKNLLKDIYSCIPLKKQHFLKNCLNQKEKLVTPRLDLDNWDRDSQKLEKILHKRGMIRLSHALSGLHPDFIWHLIHLLDSGRGRIIASHYKEEEIPSVSQALIAQVINVNNYLNKTSEP